MPYISEAYLRWLSAPERAKLLGSHLPLGIEPDTQDILYIPEVDRYAGTYVLGKQGSGKSGLLQNMISHDCLIGNGVVVIDPHGDLVSDVLAQLPPNRVKDTYILDMEDEAYPFGLNPLLPSSPITTSVARAQALNRITHIFRVLWSGVLDQQALPRYLRAAALTFLANPGTTLADMHTFLVDPHFRNNLLLKVTDSDVRNFWRYQYDELSPQQQRQISLPLVTRLEHLFMGNPLVRNILGQRETTIDFRRAFEERQIILIRLPMKNLEDQARLIGTILVTQIHAALFSFADVPQELRPGFSLYVDEFQHFTTPDFAEMFSEGRKYGVRVVLAHQYRGQLPEYLKNATSTARTIVCFGIKADDAREMASVFPGQSKGRAMESIERNTCKVLLEQTADFPELVRLFVDVWLRPLVSRHKTGEVEITDVGFHPVLIPVLFFDMFEGGGARHVTVKKPNPIPYLNALFYEAMRTGNWKLDTPNEAIIGFSNMNGRSFYQYAIRAGHDKLGGHAKPPAHLVIDDGDDLVRWTRAPEGPVETMWHLIFSIHETIRYLAEFPLGEMKELKPAEVATMLTQLPPRSAFVRCNETIGVIDTQEVPRKLVGDELNRRFIFVRDQTRAKYCRPRDVVEKTSLTHNAQPEPQPEAGMSYKPHLTTSGSPMPPPQLPADIPDEAPDDDGEGETLTVQRPSRWEDVDG